MEQIRERRACDARNKNDTREYEAQEATQLNTAIKHRGVYTCRRSRMWRLQRNVAVHDRVSPNKREDGGPRRRHLLKHAAVGQS
jgi:hypothetical protein